MKLAQLRACDGCGGPLFTPPGRWFQLVRTTAAIVTETGVKALAAALRGGALVPLDRVGLDSERGPRPSIEVLGDRDPAEIEELVLCASCYQNRPLAEVVRARRRRLEAEGPGAATTRPN